MTATTTDLQQRNSRSTSASSIDGSEAQKKGNADGSSASKRGQPSKEGGAMSSTERWRRHKEKAHPKNTKKVEEARKRDRLRKQKAREEAHPEKMEEDKTRDRLHKQKVRSSLTFEEKAQINAKRRDVREKRTPEEVANENAEMKDRVQGLRKARRVIELSQAGKFDTTKLWEVPGRDYLFTNFEDDLQSSVLLWHANTGSWWGREPKMCIAWLHFYRELGRELDPDFYKEPDPEPDPEASADAADVTEHPSEDEGMDDGCNEIRETEGLGVLEDEAGVLHDILGRPLGPDGFEVSDDKTSELTLEKDALEWLVAKNSNCGDDCVASPRKERKPAPILDVWAKTLIGLLLKVPGWWWENWRRSDRKLYDCEIVGLDYEDENGRYFLAHCKFDDERYRMNYEDVRKYARGTKQRDGRRFDLPDKAHPTLLDEQLVELRQRILCEEDVKILYTGMHDGFKIDAWVCHRFILERVSLIFDSQRVTPEKQKELALRFYKAQGRYVPWGEETVERAPPTRIELLELLAKEQERKCKEFPFCNDGVLLEVNGRTAFNHKSPTRLDVVAFGGEENVAARKTFRLCSLALEMLDDKVSLLQVVRERLTPHDHNFIHPWQTGSRTNSHERAMLECLVSMPSPEEARVFCKLFRELHHEVPSLRAAVGLNSVSGWEIDGERGLEHALMHAMDRVASSLVFLEGLEPVNAVRSFRGTLLKRSGKCSMFGASSFEEVTGTFGGVGDLTQKFFVRRFGDEEVDILSGEGPEAKTSGETSSDYEEGELPKVYRRRLGLGLGVHCQPDPGLAKLLKGEDVGRTFALGNLDSSTRQLACFPKRWYMEALSDPKNDNDNALTWLLANSNRLSAEDEAACLCKSPRSKWPSHPETGEPIDWAKMCACAEEGREKEWEEGGEDRGMSEKKEEETEESGCTSDLSDSPVSIDIEAWLQACRDTEAWLHRDNPLRGLWMRDMNRLFNLFLERLQDRALFFDKVRLGLRRNPDLMARDKARDKKKAAEAAAEEAAAALLAELDLEEKELNAGNKQKVQKRNGKKKRKKRK